MSMFDGIESPEIRVERNTTYVRAGRYLARIEKISTGQQRKPKEGKFTVIEMTILDVVDPTASADEPRGPHHVGEVVSWFMMSHWDSFLRQVKTVVVKLTGCSEEEITPEHMKTICGPAQPFAGTFIEFDAKLVDKRNNSGKFTKVSIVRTLDRDEVIARIKPEIARSLGVTETSQP